MSKYDINNVYTFFIYVQLISITQTGKENN